MWGLVTMDQRQYPFELFGVPHVMALLFCCVLIVLLYTKRQSIRQHNRRIWRYSLAVILLVSELSFHAWYIAYGSWDMTVNLPLQLSSISVYLAIIMLVTKQKNLFEITFLIGMTGGVIAMLTPELYYGFPHFRFVQFFVVHSGLVIACVYMFIIEQCSLKGLSVLKAFGTVNAIAIVVYGVNRVIGANYMFLNEKPSQLTVIDFLGPYPWYILSLEVLALGLFGLIYVLATKLKMSSL
ncbi:putative integral membrane protein (TIGR02206 family) [Alkalibacillus flavidus]|uniref:Integral membrane protein (TIGR02206 family) n=1 Tax=Alkalibacillus flavidus TaxID=546021 RepID=A0ABV2KXL6_9BACI